jgi:hypothetical protein
MKIGVFASERIISGKVLTEFLILGQDGAHELLCPGIMLTVE